MDKGPNTRHATTKFSTPLNGHMPQLWLTMTLDRRQSLKFFWYFVVHLNYHTGRWDARLTPCAIHKMHSQTIILALGLTSAYAIYSLL